MSEENARDEALNIVLDNAGDFKEQVREYVKRLPPGLELKGEGIRTRCLDRGVKPHHPNAWGAMIKTLVKEGLLEIIPGRYEAMQAKGSHARKTQVYRTKTPTVVAA